ncbi:universal stress protein [Actinomadura rudentiformis]|uniref:universal stress protein n=1 Tax=Actinomadura rudentiformis TaxID=359158 RepID=UPI00178C2C56|nr:universal stress protein [Actinomadura rudentiformis]
MIVRPEGGPRVVVGVDDSAGARCALAWAIGEARIRGLPLLVVHAAPLPAHVAAAGQLGCVTEALQSAGEQLIAQLLCEVADGSPAGVETATLSVVGEPGATLVRLARGDDILVVGRGERPALSRLLRPSVRLHCARRTRATFVCVRPPAVQSVIEELSDGERPHDRFGIRRLSQLLWGSDSGTVNGTKDR